MQAMHVADPHAHKWLFESRRCVAEPGWRNGASSRPGGTGCGSVSASRRPKLPWPGSWRFGRLTRPHGGHGPPSASTACGVMERTSSGQARRRQLRKNNLQEFRESGSDVPVGTAASARSFQALRAFTKASAFETLVRQRPLTPSCRGLSPYCGENSEPGRYSMESLTSNPELENSLG